MDYKQQMIDKAIAFHKEYGILPFKISVSPFVWNQIDSEPFGTPQTLKNVSYMLDGRVMRLQLRSRSIGSDEMGKLEISLQGTMVVKDALYE